MFHVNLTMKSRSLFNTRHACTDDYYANPRTFLCYLRGAQPEVVKPQPNDAAELVES